MRVRVSIWIVFTGACVLHQSARAQWTQVVPGIEYAEFTTADPNNLFVTRMDRSNTGVTLESSVANGTVSGARETVRNQAARYDDTISWWGQSWGQRNDVIVAVNGDFFNGTTGVITGGQCHSGWYSKRFGDFGGYSGFGWTVNRVPFIGGCINHQAAKQTVTYPATGNTQQFKGINRARGSDELIVYTPQYNSTTLTDGSGSEVLVEMTRPNVIISPPNKAIGYVRQIRQNLGSTSIPFDHVVLSATGSAATTLLNNVSVGAEVDLSQIISDYNEPDTSGDNGCAYATGLDWQKTFAAVGVNYRYLEDGVVRPPDPDHSGYAGLIVRNPRTAVAYNDTHIFFVVCDGRSAQSVGMTMTELGNFCIDYLGATEGANLDGGGSSTMVVNGVVKNDPSDGSERTVANGMMMVVVQPKLQSTAFYPGDTVKTNTTANVRLGPGTNYAAITTVTVNTQGLVLDHSLRGVYAKGYYWWKCQFPAATGWVAQDLLTLVGSEPPRITQQPSGQTVATGDTAIFIVEAIGAGSLTYRWQKNSVDLDNGGHYSGVTTNTLTISTADSGDAANYRCVVSNLYGSTPSDQAALEVTPPPGPPGDFDGDLDVDQDDFGCFQACLTGPAVPQNDPACAKALLDDATGVADGDMILFLQCMSGPGVPADPNCASSP